MMLTRMYVVDPVTGCWDWLGHGVAANTVRQVLRGVRWPESARPTRGRG